jgi:hypothetical protein
MRVHVGTKRQGGLKKGLSPQSFYSSHQWSATYDKWLKLRPLATFIGKILLELCHTYSFTCFLCLLSNYNGRVEQ